MKNKIKTVFLIITLVIIIFTIMPIQVKAFKDPAKDPNSWAPKNDTSNSTKYKSMVGKILGTINVIGIVVSVIVLIIIGIKYMLGSIEEKAEYKKTVMGYVIGAVMLFSCTTVANILYNIGTSIA